MTEAYDLFLHELKAQGRERYDGFSTGNLSRLSDQERLLVRQALIDLLGQRDMRAPPVLAQLSPEPATAALLTSALSPQAAGGDPTLWADFDIQVVVALAMLGAELPFALDALEAIMRDTTDGWKRGLAMDGLRWADANSDASARLGRLVRSNLKEGIRADGADTLLQRHGWRLTDQATQAEALVLLKALVDGDAAQRDQALIKILKTPVKL